MRSVQVLTGAVGARRAVRAAARASRVAAGACDASRTAARLCQPAEKLRTRTTVEPGLGCGIGTRSRVLRTARVPQKKSNGPARRGASASISATRISATAGVAPHDRAIVREILIIFLLLFCVLFSLAHRDRACARRRTTVSCGLRGVEGGRGKGTDAEREIERRERERTGGPRRRGSIFQWGNRVNRGRTGKKLETNGRTAAEKGQNIGRKKG